MDDIVRQALAKWPNVPHCYGWLGLDARGNWYMRDDRTQAAGSFPAAKGSLLRHDKLIDFIQRIGAGSQVKLQYVALEHADATSVSNFLSQVFARVQIGTSGNDAVVEDESWLQTEAWRILHPNMSPNDQLIAQATLKRTLERLPHILEGLV